MWRRINGNLARLVYFLGWQTSNIIWAIAQSSVARRHSGKLEAPAEAVLKCLGELKRPYLAEFEEKLLSFIEQECKAGD